MLHVSKLLTFFPAMISLSNGYMLRFQLSVDLFFYNFILLSVKFDSINDEEYFFSEYLHQLLLFIKNDWQFFVMLIKYSNLVLDEFVFIILENTLVLVDRLFHFFRNVRPITNGYCFLLSI